MLYGWHHTNTSLFPENIVAWLQIDGNLTKKLVSLGKHTLSLISQDYVNLPPEENRYLQQTQTHGLIRNIAHIINGDTLVLARTVISDNLYHQYQKDFDNLGINPIGQTLLYHRQDMQRSAFEYGYVCAGQITQPFENIFTPTSNVAARRSLFNVNNTSLMITELFLPKIQDYDLP